MPDATKVQTQSAPFTALHLVVNNHPGVMSHVCGLFARRAFNLEGILVTPSKKDATCDVWLIVNEDKRIVQIMNQVKKLHDVLDVRPTSLSDAALRKMASCLVQ
ncbi:ACT domain-containing protein [Desulfovibrio sp. OttesenSCG-928-G15]|nr:ACT domain-containing protein [Desulfovibrio sp. OttesenSCG-928-G15]